MAKGSSSVAVPANDTFSVDIPFAPPKPEGVPQTYRQRTVEFRMNEKEAEGLALLHDGVYGNHVTFRGGLHCDLPQDSLRWLLAKIADRHAAAMNR